MHFYQVFIKTLKIMRDKDFCKGEWKVKCKHMGQSIQEWIK